MLHLHSLSLAVVRARLILIGPHDAVRTSIRTSGQLTLRPRLHPFQAPPLAPRPTRTHIQVIPRRDRQHPLAARVRHEGKLVAPALGLVIPLVSPRRRRRRGGFFAPPFLPLRLRLRLRLVPTCVPFRRGGGLGVKECLQVLERCERVDDLVRLCG